VRLTPSPAAARGYTTPGGEAGQVLWRNAPLAFTRQAPQPSRLQLQQNLRSALATDPTLSELYSWRQMLRGNAKREWHLGNSSHGDLHLGLGAQALPVLQLSGLVGTRAALGLAGERFGVYTTRPLRALNAALQPADEVLGEATSHDASALDWITLRPLSSSRGAVDVIYLHGQNDLNPNSLTKTPSQFMRGEMAGATVAYNLPMQWKLNGEWLTSRMQDHAGDSAWQLALAGPIKHPWGQTGVKISYRDVGADFLSFRGTLADAGSITKQIALQQPIGNGRWSGSVGLNWTQQEHDAASTSQTNSDLAATATARWQVLPDVALTGAVSTRNNSTETASEVLSAQQSTNSRAAVEWKVGDGLNLTVGYDASRQSTPAVGATQSVIGNNRLSLALQQRSADTTWNLQVARDAALGAAGSAAGTADSLAFGADHRLASWLKLGGTYRVAQCDSLTSATTPASDLTAHAAISLQEMGSLELRYTQALSTQPNGVRLGEESVAHGYGVRYVLGAADNTGLGLTLDFSQRDLPGYDDPERQWRIGLTYR
jgi:hypothetical protein